MSPDPDGPDLTLTVFILALLFILGAIYASSESYLLSVNEKNLKRDAESGNGRARLITAVADRRKGTFSALQFGTVLAGVFFCALAAFSFSSPLAALMGKAPFHTALAFAVCVLGSALVFFVFADFVPKKLTAHRSGKTDYGAARFIWVMSGLMLPLFYFCNGASNLFLRLFGFDPHNLEEKITEEEIMMLLGESEDNIEETEKDMIENVFDFNDINASEIMTHRIDISALPDTASIEDIIGLSVEMGFSRIPVYHEDIDSVSGILYVKDLLPYVGKSVPEFIDLGDMLRPAYFIPESKKCSQLFSEMTERKVQIAIIVDEYGGTSGLVTLEDLVESIFGNIQDEYDNEEEEITRVGEDEFTVDGSTPIDEISELTDTELPEGDYDTVAGFITEQLGRILRDDERPVLEVMGLEIRVVEVEDQRITKLTVKKLPRDTADNDSEKTPENKED